MQVSCVFINFHTKITLRPLQYNTNYSRMDRVLISIIVIIIYTINEFDCMSLAEVDLCRQRMDLAEKLLSCLCAGF